MKETNFEDSFLSCFAYIIGEVNAKHMWQLINYL